MKERIGYLTEYEYLTLPADKKYQYIKKLENLKRRMRSLIADQENSLNVVKFYMGYSEIQDKAYFNSSMLKSFVGKELYYDDIRRIKNGKEAYDRASLSVKKNIIIQLIILLCQQCLIIIFTEKQ